VDNRSVRQRAQAQYVMGFGWYESGYDRLAINRSSYRSGSAMPKLTPGFWAGFLCWEATNSPIE